MTDLTKLANVHSVTVNDAFHGCETGCTGIRIEIFDKEGEEIFSEFQFNWWYSSIETKEEFIKGLIGGRGIDMHKIIINLDDSALIDGGI